LKPLAEPFLGLSISVSRTRCQHQGDGGGQEATHTFAVSKKFPPNPAYVSRILNDVSLSHLPYLSLCASPKVMVPRHMGETMTEAEGDS
jgi:hypothetical protein